ncbi:hypothetical protein [Bathymodiolus septemdierum thioautotrophic gill symbiont]|uniref:Uncharacterized protein n=1 Tax=endosymbiont of Bathymodiolus septemdierum str. Myojin knoll TaxID=1303921 RepID=A0A0P0UQ75_9GAMM|nr:hypothetical protein [Bathymodiolus septemdierum thioautotrophic gill symbiont]BAS67185.1 hypothetical protein BSEPE_0161 [endosymbiont of Bathymodiolus septemdierum str. Myojin knoll]
MTEYKRIDESAWNNFGKSLLNNKGSDEQIEFLQICRNGKKDFLNYLNEKLINDKDIIIEGGNIYFDHQFTEAEFRFPPIDTQKIIWDAFEKVEREYMGYCGFWGNVIINMIKYDCIKPEYLASNLNGVNETGIYMLDSAITSDDNKKVDDCVRRILRSMGNPAPRGKRIVFNDFYLGKAYWRWNWANKMSNEISLNFEEILTIFDETSYGVFSERMFSKDSYISQINTLGGLLLFLNENNLKGKLNNVIKTISYLSAWKAIEIQTPELNREEIKLIANNL